VTEDVVALYVEPRGPYPKLVREWYDEKRDARTYQGGKPVVAHPPCGPWSRLKHLHKKPEEAELGLLAVEQVRKNGGVLEQPANSKLWDAAGLPRPGEHDAYGFSIVVDQCAWGHVARKTTWLYFVRVDKNLVDRTCRFGGTPTHWCSGSRTAPRGPVPPGIKVCSKAQRNRTPLAFAEWLIEMARDAKR